MGNKEETKRDETRVPDKIPKDVPKAQGLRKVNLIEAIKEAEQIANYVVESDTFGLVFAKKDKDGKTVINKNDVIVAIITGRELGLTDMASVTFGRQLDRHAFFKVMKGAALGLDPITSLDQINVISTKNGDVIHTGISVIASALLRNNINFEFLEDAVPEYSYCRVKDDAELGTELKDNYFLITAKPDKDKLQKASERGDMLVYKKIKDIKTTVKLIRKDNPPFQLTYRRSQAIEADLYIGTKKDGTISEGKANWNNHFETMLRNRTLTIAGRIYGADVLQGTYSNEEAQEIVDITYTEVDNEELDKKVKEDIETNVD